VWLTHRTWINRIRPIFSRHPHDAPGQSTRTPPEAFGGIRVVRAFGPPGAAEAGRFTTDNHYMTRQELFAVGGGLRGIDNRLGRWLIPLASAVLLWYGGSKVARRQGRDRGRETLDAHAAFHEPATLSCFLAYLTSAASAPIAALAESATGLQNQLAGVSTARST